jgi:hypothetical protein
MLVVEMFLLQLPPVAETQGTGQPWQAESGWLMKLMKLRRVALLRSKQLPCIRRLGGLQLCYTRLDLALSA